MYAALVAGLVYFAAVFAVGFVLGTLRVLVVQRLTGATAAVLAELPVMLAVSWLACREAIRRCAVPNGWRQRGIMGGAALALLLLAELGLSVLAFGRSPREHLRRYREQDAWLGLLGQLAFALFPVLQVQRRTDRG